MRSLFIFALVIVGISALPQHRLSGDDVRDPRIITDTIASIIEELSHGIKEAGLDPVHIENESGGYALPVPVIFSAYGLIEELLVRGLSDIVIDHINFSLLSGRLELTLTLPLIEASLERAEGNVVFFAKDIKATAGGSIYISNIRVPAVVDIHIGIISGIGITNVDLDCSIGHIKSNLNVVVQDVDLSQPINIFLGQTVPKTFNELRAEINELLEIIVFDIISGLF